MPSTTRGSHKAKEAMRVATQHTPTSSSLLPPTSTKVHKASGGGGSATKANKASGGGGSSTKANEASTGGARVAKANKASMSIRANEASTGGARVAKADKASTSIRANKASTGGARVTKVIQANKASTGIRAIKATTGGARATKAEKVSKSVAGAIKTKKASKSVAGATKTTAATKGDLQKFEMAMKAKLSTAAVRTILPSIRHRDMLRSNFAVSGDKLIAQQTPPGLYPIVVQFNAIADVIRMRCGHGGTPGCNSTCAYTMEFPTSCTNKFRPHVHTSNDSVPTFWGVVPAHSAHDFSASSGGANYFRTAIAVGSEPLAELFDCDAETYLSALDDARRGE